MTACPRAVWVRFHPLERPQPFAMSGDEGPVVADTARGTLLGWTEPSEAPETQASKLSPCRPATREEVALSVQRRLFAAEAADYARQQLAALQLPMTVHSAAASLDGNSLVIYFTAPDRVDFRPAVRVLTQQYRKKLEFYQLSDRQRAQRHGAEGRCGRECCCSVWLREFPATSVRLAGEQGFSLQPEAITGVCGRLLCCLRYEYESFLEQRQNVEIGSRVVTPEGEMVVLGINPHDRTLLLQHPEQGPIKVPMGRVRSLSPCQSCSAKPDP